MALSEPSLHETMPRRTDLEILRESRAWAQASDRRAVWQLLVLGTGLGLVLVGIGGAPSAGAAMLAIPLLVGLIVRAFILQHDCGHGSLLSTRRANLVAGQLCAFVTGVPYLPWATEHAWHHAHQGKLHERGVDRVNSPMTVAEARQDPARATQRQTLIRWRTIALGGAWGVMFGRKKLHNFFMFRPTFRHPPREADAQRLRNNLRLTVGGHLLLQVALVLLLGPRWLGVALLSWWLAAMIAGFLFWIQHNFAPGYHADREQWSSVAVALRGSSYLKLPPVLRWFTGNIGLHHVHHLNARIPNYRLEAARRAIPELAAVSPLRRVDLQRSVTAVFWDPVAQTMTASR